MNPDTNAQLEADKMQNEAQVIEPLQHGESRYTGHTKRNLEATLADKMEQNLLRVRKRNMLLLNALSNGSKTEFEQQLFSFKIALKEHLKLVGSELYVQVRQQLTGDSRLDEFLEFQAKTTALMERIAALLTRCEGAGFSHKLLFAKAIGSTNKLLVKRFKEEKAYLLPIRTAPGNRNSLKH